MSTGVTIQGKGPAFPDDRTADEIGRRTLLEVNALAASRIKEMLLTAPDVRGFIGRKDTGLAHNLVTASAPTKIAGGWRGVVAFGPPRDAIGIVLEKGRRPGARMPPAKPLVEWAKRRLRSKIAAGMRGAKSSLKGRTAHETIRQRELTHGRKDIGPWKPPKRVTGVSKARVDKEAERIGFAIARSIARKGTPGLHAYAKTAAWLRAGKAKEVLARVTRRVLDQGKRS